MCVEIRAQRRFASAWTTPLVPPVAGMRRGCLKCLAPASVASVAGPLSRFFKTRSGMNRRAGRAILLPVPPGSGTHALLLRRERGRVWAVYYRQIRKSEQRPPLHLRAADLVPVCGRFVTNSPHTPRPTARTPEKCVCGRPRRHPGPEKCFLSPPPVVYCTNFRARFEIFIFGFSQVIYYHCAKGQPPPKTPQFVAAPSKKQKSFCFLAAERNTISSTPARSRREEQRG